MRKSEATAKIIENFAEEPIVFSTGYISRIACNVRDSANHFYMVGSMGLASSIAVGIATRTTSQVIVVEGDGSALMGLNGLLLHEDVERPINLLHIVLDDGEYDSTGGQPCPPSGRRIADLARAAGYAAVHQASTLDELEHLLHQNHTSTPPTVAMLHCSVQPEHSAPPRINLELPEIFDRLHKYLQSAHGLATTAPTGSAQQA